ncbi:hypothetical protein ETF27_09270 [Prevotella brunnea]|uniref:Uncharacterized protein n=1 Tax=Prevotella brunnea TaxID=2508867 RepID=A0A5C8GD97_9BACT|nr:hypothetical protein [Prevotella brunnea]MDR0186085.1 hypothetical protein [Prevotella brunnea]TXJ59739.1 hypothetical protein ETF27_09270 [Prevotella brunnea]
MPNGELSGGKKSAATTQKVSLHPAKADLFINVIYHLSHDYNTKSKKADCLLLFSFTASAIVPSDHTITKSVRAASSE